MGFKGKVVLIGVVSLGIATNLFCQICEGNLGENIFLDGDFGSGTANILATNPQIAPGYIYTTNPPPNDGLYTIANNTNWPNTFQNWKFINDNSGTPNGYMMVVNASYSPGLFYQKEVTGLCENTLYEFSVDIYNLIATGANWIKPNVSFLIDGTIIYSTGDIPENEKWNTYGFTFSTNPGQTSVILSLQNNAPGGIGNDLALDNITFRPCGPEALILPTTIANICEDGNPIDLTATVNGSQYDNPAFQWQQSLDGGLTWITLAGETNTVFTHTNLMSGMYYYRFLLANGPGNLDNPKCRVISNVKIVNVAPKFYSIVDTLCEGLSFAVGSNFYSSTGIYVDSLISSLGCDSIVTLDLTIVPDIGISVAFDLEGPSCDYLEDGSVAINTITNGVAPFTYLFNGEQTSTTSIVSNLPQGDYPVSITDYFGCSLDTIIKIQSPDPFLVDIGPDLTINLGETVQVFPKANQLINDFAWQPADLIGCDTGCWNLNWPPANSMTLSLVVTSINNCQASDTLHIEVVKNRLIFIPNAFSPNGDGINDFFTAHGAVPNVKIIERFLVFNRWGDLVYEAWDLLPNDVLAGWDGNFNGKALEPGMFTYLLEIRFLDDVVKIYSGDVILIR